jgi:two-component sensor histidine kinase
VHLSWTERNGPTVQAAERRSFGTRLIETLGKQFRGNVQLTYGPAGFVYALDMPRVSLI